MDLCSSSMAENIIHSVKQSFNYDTASLFKHSLHTFVFFLCLTNSYHMTFLPKQTLTLHTVQSNPYNIVPLAYQKKKFSDLHLCRIKQILMTLYFCWIKILCHSTSAQTNKFLQQSTSGESKSSDTIPLLNETNSYGVVPLLNETKSSYTVALLNQNLMSLYRC